MADMSQMLPFFFPATFNAFALHKTHEVWRDGYSARSPAAVHLWVLGGERFACFLVQDRLRASDVLHRDWDWSGWL